MKTPPNELWERGTHGHCSTVVLEVRVCLDAAGHLWSAHNYQQVEDEARANSWAGGGVRQISFALLTEALRREVYACALIELTKNPEYLKKFQAADEKTKEELSLALGEGAVQVLTNTSKRMAQGAAQEILAMLLSQSQLQTATLNSSGAE